MQTVCNNILFVQLLQYFTCFHVGRATSATYALRYRAHLSRVIHDVSTETSDGVTKNNSSYDDSGVSGNSDEEESHGGDSGPHRQWFRAFK